jgi:predicted nucleic acid-binding protein
MSAERFFDTNVIFYSLSDDQAKAEIAQAAIKDGGTISVQVLNELTLALRRKMKLPWASIDGHLQTLSPFFLVIRPMTMATHLLGRNIAERFQLQFYDSLLLASALEAGCTHFISEDMKGGMVIDGLKVVNPFTP